MRTIDSADFNIQTDAGPEDVAHLECVLRELRAQFLETFSPLLRQEPVPGKIRLVFFNSEANFREYARRVAPALAGSAGFYASSDDRLAVLNQAGSSGFTRVRDQLTTRQRHLAPDERIQAAAWRDELDNEARASTDRLLRHEGAHQLFHACRIESPQPVEPTWLTEGLAQYCEPASLGAFYDSLAQRVRHARDTGTLLPMDRLLNHRDTAGFFALPADQIETAYAQSWALVYWLMDCHRDEFFDYIRQCQADQCPALPASLQSQWQTYINNL